MAGPVVVESTVIKVTILCDNVLVCICCRGDERIGGCRKVAALLNTVGRPQDNVHSLGRIIPGFTRRTTILY